MRIFTSFWHSFINSASSPEYYNDVLKAKPSFSWKYLAMLVGLFAVIGAAEMLAYTFPAVNSFDANKAITQIGDLYPDDLAINVTNGVVSINQELPYAISMPKEWVSDEFLGSDMVNLVLFTTDNAVSSALRDQSSAIIVGETVVYAPSDSVNGAYTYSVIPIPNDSEPLLITSTDVHTFVTSVLEWPLIAHRWFVPAYVMLVVIGALLFYPFILLFRVSVVFMLALLGWLISLIMSKKLSYMDSVRLSIHATTPLLIIGALFSFLGIMFMNVWVFIIIYIVWIIMVLRSITSVPTPTTP